MMDFIKKCEIEMWVLGLPGVRQAKIVDWSYQHDHFIVALVVMEGGADYSVAVFQTELLSQLAIEDVPQIFLSVEHIHLGEDDEVEIGRYESLLLNQVSSEKGDPTELELLIGAIWKQELQLEKVGRNDSLFALGGSSLIAVKLAEVMSQQLAVTVTTTDLFMFRTIESLARALQERAENESVEEGEF